MFEFVYKRQKKGVEPRMNETQLDDLLRRAAATQRLAVERSLAELAVTPTQYAVLKAIAETPGLSNAEIARIERLTPQTTGLVIANLERKGAVTRRAHERHGRIRRAEATALGASLLEECRARLRGHHRRLKAALPAGGSAGVEAWLGRLAELRV
jgi:DNA-binding MarR family transcriptional regulator